MKVKLINGVITEAPKTVIYENTKYIGGVPDEVLTALGYKTLVHTTPPEAEEGFHAVPHWEEKPSTIRQVWELVADEPYVETVEDYKAKLSETDYHAIKYAEGWITEEDYAPIKAQRQAWRDAINALEETDA